MWRLFWPVSVLLMLGACSTATETDPARGCGVYAVRSLRGPRLDPMGPIPGCALPTDQEIAAACGAQLWRARSRPTRLEIRGASCAFSNRSHSRASCAFDLIEYTASTASQSQRSQMTFVHRYEEAHEPEASGSTTSWVADGPCEGSNVGRFLGRGQVNGSFASGRS
jgi:hypothetical protein